MRALTIVPLPVYLNYRFNSVNGEILLIKQFFYILEFDDIALTVKRASIICVFMRVVTAKPFMYFMRFFAFGCKILPNRKQVYRC